MVQEIWKVQLTFPDIWDVNFVKKYFDYKKYFFYEEAFELNIVGFRRLGTKVNTFNDYIGVFYKDFREDRKSFFRATTRPGLSYLLKPLLSKGTAILVPGQYVRAYELGEHKGREALIQVGEVEVFRDKNLDAKFDEDRHSIDKGFFGINIHRAGPYAKWVNKNSAGCQVIQDELAFEDFINICERSKQYVNKKFTYTLLEFS